MKPDLSGECVTTDYDNVAERFDPALAAVAEALDRSRLEWFVVAGWALDLFLNVKTRSHKDIEVSIWRDQAESLFDFYVERRIDLVVGDKRYQSIFVPSDVDTRGHLIIRNGAFLQLQPLDIELFLSSRHNGHWNFRKEPTITVPLEFAVVQTASGLRVLAPHLVLLFKAWFFPNLEKAIHHAPQHEEFFRKCWQMDCRDFDLVLPFLSTLQREMLERWLKEFVPSIPWLTAFSSRS
ncbi:hypothetical protein EBR21_10575 [bacterium]|nr:hypothetical protein [bacterium]